MAHDVVEDLLAGCLELQVTGRGEELEDQTLVIKHLHLRALVDVEVAHVLVQVLLVAAATEAVFVERHPPRMTRRENRVRTVQLALAVLGSRGSGATRACKSPYILVQCGTMQHGTVQYVQYVQFVRHVQYVHTVQNVYVRMHYTNYIKYT